MLAFFGLDCSDSLDQWRDIKAAVLAPLIGPLNFVQMLTVANVAWIVLFGMRGWQAWRSRPRPHVAGIVVAISGMVLGGQLQVMTVLLERAAQRFDADVIPSDAELIARLEESRERFDSWVPILRDFEGWWPERGIAPYEWPFASEPGGEVNDRLRIYQNPLMKHDYAAAEDGLFPRRGWLVQDQGRRIHLAHDLRGIKPYFLIKGSLSRTAAGAAARQPRRHRRRPAGLQGLPARRRRLVPLRAADAGAALSCMPGFSRTRCSPDTPLTRHQNDHLGRLRRSHRVRFWERSAHLLPEARDGGAPARDRGPS